MNLTIVQAAPSRVSVGGATPTVVGVTTKTEQVEVKAYISQPQAGGMWVETNINGDPDAWTIWIEDGN